MIISKKKIVIIGGGAAGFFAAANLPYSADYEVVILEASHELMKKILISGGGRCNVTHACFDPKELVTYYPRGYHELLSPFYTFNPTQTLSWFKQRKVTIVNEEDNRMFPSTNSSETIANTLHQAALENKVEIIFKEKVHDIKWHAANKIQIFSTSKKFDADYVIVATGSNFPFYKVLREVGIKIIDSVPSLFTFNISDKKLLALMGVSFPLVAVKIKNSKLTSSGPMLITHWGLSGPSILKLSAWGARELADLKYSFNISINFVGKPYEQVLNELNEYKTIHAKKTICSNPIYNIPKRYWNFITDNCGIDSKAQWAQITKATMSLLIKELTEKEFAVQGKSTYKDEFVTAGGVSLNEINFKSFEHKQLKGMYFVGEVLDIDGITGGFNFQNCWTSAYVATKDILSKM